MSDKRHFVFFFPYRGFGGVPVLFLRLAEWISQNTNHLVYIVDYADGYMAKFNKNEKISLLVYDQQKPIPIPSNSILIFQSDLPWGLPQNLLVDESVTAFFWNCYPFNLIPVLPGSAREWMSQSLTRIRLILNTLLLPAKIRCRNFLKFLIEKRAITFMDGPNVSFTEKALSFSIPEPDYLPILLPKTDYLPILNTLKNDFLVGAWIGRIADFKVYSLIHTIIKISEWTLQNKKSFYFKVIGEGNRLEELKASIPRNPYLTVEFLGSMPTNELEAYLRDHVDILFAMGTSALEGAKLKVATVLLDFSYDKFPSNYKFRWLFEAKEFSLGSPLDLLDLHDGKEIDEIFNSYKVNFNEINSNCFEYFSKNHSLESYMSKFLKQSHESCFIYSDFLKNNLSKKP